VSWLSPVARALIQARQGDIVELRAPAGIEQIVVAWLAFPFLPERPTCSQGGTDGSNPLSSSRESAANLTSWIRAPETGRRLLSEHQRLDGRPEDKSSRGHRFGSAGAPVRPGRPRRPGPCRDDTQRERAAAAVKTWLLAQIEKNRAEPASDIVKTASDGAVRPRTTRGLRTTGPRRCGWRASSSR
jgi:hypothetical protein